MTKPLALDLFCCAGGSAVGLERAGFRVIGIDHKPSEHWCGEGEVHRADLSTADAVEAVIRAFEPAFVSASPPCQRFSMATPTANREDHPNLIPATREAIRRSGVPGWIENVQGAPLEHGIRLCGSMFPETQRLRRHRWFELIGWWTFEPAHMNCTYEPVSVAGHGPPDATQAAKYRRLRGGRREVITVSGDNGNRGRGSRRKVVGVFGRGLEGPGQTYGQNRPGPQCIRWREAMGWLDGPRHRYSLAQAIPPAYGEWLGRAFLARQARALP